MKPQHTVEIRWFQEGPTPAEVTEWLEGRLAGEDRRTDLYLPLPTCETVGVKLRGGQFFEVKLRDNPVLSWDSPGGGSGWVEHWTKWSFPDGWVGRVVRAVRARNSHWVSVDKQRRLGTIEGDRAGCEFSADSPVREVTLELTEVSSLGRRWWTVALEGPQGPAGGSEAALCRVAEQVLSAGAPVHHFTAESSFSYPAWLSRICPPA